MKVLRFQYIKGFCSRKCSIVINLLLLLLISMSGFIEDKASGQVYSSGESSNGDPKPPLSCEKDPVGVYADYLKGKPFKNHPHLNTETNQAGESVLVFEEQLCNQKKKCIQCRQPKCGQDCGPQFGNTCPTSCPISESFPLCGDCQIPPIGPPATCEAAVSQCTVDDVKSRGTTNVAVPGDPNGLVLKEGQEVVLWIQAEDHPTIKKAEKLMRMLENNLAVDEFLTDTELLDSPKVLSTVLGMDVHLAKTVVEYTSPIVPYILPANIKVIPRSEIPQTLDKIPSLLGTYYTLLRIYQKDNPDDPDPDNPGVTKVHQFILKFKEVCVQTSIFVPGNGCTAWKRGWIPWRHGLGGRDTEEAALQERMQRLEAEENYSFNDEALGWTQFGMSMWPGASGAEQLFYGEDYKAKAFGAVYFAGDVLSFGVGAKVKAGRLACQAVAAGSTALAVGEMATQIINDPSKRGFFPVAATVLLTVSAGNDGIKLLKGIRMKATRGADGALRLVPHPEMSIQDRELGAKLLAEAADLTDAASSAKIRDIALNGINDAVAKRKWYVRVMKNICEALQPEPNTTILWTGLLDMPSDMRIQVMHLAAEYAMATGSNTLEMMLKKAGIFDPADIKRLAGNPSAIDWTSLMNALDDAMLGNGRISRAQAGEFWEFVSRTLVRNSRGKVKMVVGDSIKNSAISWTEIHESLKNKKISEFVVVMPKTIGDKVVEMVEMKIWQRCEKTGEIMWIDPKHNPLLKVNISVQNGWEWKKTFFEPTFRNAGTIQNIPELQWLVDLMFSEKCPRLP